MQTWKVLLRGINVSGKNLIKMQYFLHHQPENEMIEATEKLSFLPDSFSIHKNVVYVYCLDGYGKTKINNTFFERKLGVMATTRNIATVE